MNITTIDKVVEAIGAKRLPYNDSGDFDDGEWWIYQEIENDYVLAIVAGQLTYAGAFVCIEKLDIHIQHSLGEFPVVAKITGFPGNCASDLLAAVTAAVTEWAKEVPPPELCDKECWQHFHMTGGLHRTDCAAYQWTEHSRDSNYSIERH